VFNPKTMFYAIRLFFKNAINKLFTSEDQPILPQPGTMKSTNPITRSIIKNLGTLNSLLGRMGPFLPKNLFFTSGDGLKRTSWLKYS